MSTGILDMVEHNRLIADMEHVCTVANVPDKFVRSSMTDWCGPEEIDWVRNYRKYRLEKSGLIITGANAPSNRCMAICGALIRNFIDARLTSPTALLDAAKKEDIPDPTVMIIQNMFMDSNGRTFASWQVQVLFDILVSRMTGNKQTVMYVESLQALGTVYGPVFHDLLKSNYKIIS